MEKVWERVAQCREMTPAFPHSARTAAGMAAQCGLVKQRRDMIPRRCQRASVVGLTFDSSARDTLGHLMLRSGEQVRTRGSKAASSETETCSGVPIPRARRRLVRGSIKPSSGAETSPEGASSPRARWRFARGGACPSVEVRISWCGAWPSSGAEFRSRGPRCDAPGF
jgi:hypothetical protein